MITIFVIVYAVAVFGLLAYVDNSEGQGKGWAYLAGAVLFFLPLVAWLAGAIAFNG